MRMKYKLIAAILAWTAGTWTLTVAAQVPLARDLAADGRQALARRVPILVVFSSINCSYCKQALNGYLNPMEHDADYAGRIVMRHVEIDSTREMRDFSGQVTSHKAFAKTQKIGLTPTVKLFDSAGRELSDAVVGLPPAFYGAYLDRAIEEALAKLRADEPARRSVTLK